MGGQNHPHSPEAMPKKEQDLDQLKAARIPMALRDNCAHLLVGLNECRRATFFSPHQCVHQRHIYEECQYIAWNARVERKKQTTQ